MPPVSHHRDLLRSLAGAEIPAASLERVAARLADITDWDSFLRDVEKHGLSGLVLRHAADDGLTIPAEVVLRLKALSLRHRAIAEARYRELRRILPELKAAGCRPLFLKGIALTPLVYSDAALRPMRDIDVLIPRSQKHRVADVIRDLGYVLPERHRDRYNRDSHQLPDAWKRVQGFRITLEIHLDAIERDAPGHLFHEDIEPVQSVRWRDLEFETLGHEQMLQQLCGHLAGRHPGGLLKLINVSDIVRYSEFFMDEIDWPALDVKYPRVANTLRCLHLVIPLSPALQDRVGDVSFAQVRGIGETVPPLKGVVYGKGRLTDRVRSLLLPPDWWLHLYYGVAPGRSLASVKLWRHPAALLPYFGRRIKSRILGG